MLIRYVSLRLFDHYESVRKLVLGGNFPCGDLIWQQILKWQISRSASTSSIICRDVKAEILFFVIFTNSQKSVVNLGQKFTQAQTCKKKFFLKIFLVFFNKKKRYVLIVPESSCLFICIRIVPVYKTTRMRNPTANRIACLHSP